MNRMLLIITLTGAAMVAVTAFAQAAPLWSGDSLRTIAHVAAGQPS